MGWFSSSSSSTGSASTAPETATAAAAGPKAMTDTDLFFTPVSPSSSPADSLTDNDDGKTPLYNDQEPSSSLTSSHNSSSSRLPLLSPSHHDHWWQRVPWIGRRGTSSSSGSSSSAISAAEAQEEAEEDHHAVAIRRPTSQYDHQQRIPYKGLREAAEAELARHGSSNTVSSNNNSDRGGIYIGDKSSLSHDDHEPLSYAASAVGPTAVLHLPHFSRVTDPVESINVITGRSLYFGMQPWRCSDRFSDWVLSLSALDPPSIQIHHLNLLRACARSHWGEEPTDNYYRLQRASIMFYKDRAEGGMLRERLLEPSSFNALDVRRIYEEDGMRARTYRQQRKLEHDALAGSLDNLLVKQALPAGGGRRGGREQERQGDDAAMAPATTTTDKERLSEAELRQRLSAPSSVDTQFMHMRAPFASGAKAD